MPELMRQPREPRRAAFADGGNDLAHVKPCAWIEPHGGRAIVGRPPAQVKLAGLRGRRQTAHLVDSAPPIKPD